MDDQLEAKRQQYLKEIEQGSKLEQLYTQEDFQFFMGWIELVRDEYADQILSGDLLDSQRREDFAKGIHFALNMISDSAKQFSTKAKAARRKLEELERYLSEES